MLFTSRTQSISFSQQRGQGDGWGGYAELEKYYVYITSETFFLWNVLKSDLKHLLKLILMEGG